MKILRDKLDQLEPHFHKGGRLERLDEVEFASKMPVETP